MAISHIEGIVDGNNAASATLTKAFTNFPTNGNILLTSVGCFFPDATTTLSITTPSGNTLRQNLDAGGDLAAMLYSKVASSESKDVTATKTGDNEALAVAAVEIAGSNGYDTSGKATTSSGTQLTVNTDANVTANGSRAYAVFYTQQISGGYTPTAPTGWTLIAEEHGTNSSYVGVHLYYKDVNAGALSATFSRTGAASRIKGFILVVGPGNDDPVLTVPGAKRYAIGVDEVLGGISIVDGDNDESVLTLSCTKGTFDAPTPTNVDVAGENTNSMTLTGTTTELNAYLAAGDGPRYKHTTANHDADTITVNIDDQVGTPDEETIAVTAVDAHGSASNMADLNGLISGFVVNESVEGTTNMTVRVTDSGGRYHEITIPITVGAAIVPAIGAAYVSRRRKR